MRCSLHKIMALGERLDASRFSPHKGRMGEVDILALGEPLIEMVRMPRRHQGRWRYQSGVGGDALNALVAAARQGARTGLITGLGGDPFGEDVLAFCRDEGIDVSNVVIRDQDPTGVAFIHPDPTQRRFSYARRGSAASHYGVGDLPERAIAAARILHVTAVSQAISASMRAAVRRAAEMAKAHGVWVSYDLNLRLNLWTLDDARACVEDFLPLADIVLPSDDEAAVLTGSDDQAAHLDYFARGGARWVALKRGAEGVVLRGRDGQETIPAAPANPVDSAGAGDSFAGAFLAYLLETGDAAKAARLAVRVAAATVEGYGATDSIPRRIAELGAETAASRPGGR